MVADNQQEDKRRTSKLRNDFQACLERFQDVSKVAINKSNETVAPKPTKGGLLSNPAYAASSPSPSFAHIPVVCRGCNAPCGVRVVLLCLH